MFISITHHLLSNDHHHVNNKADLRKRLAYNIYNRFVLSLFVYVISQLFFVLSTHQHSYGFVFTPFTTQLIQIRYNFFD